MAKVIKYAELNFVVSLCVHSICAIPQRGQDGSTKGAEGEEYVPNLVKIYLLGFRQISEVAIFMQKHRFPRFHRRLASLDRIK